MDIIIGTTTLSTTADQDTGLAQQAGDTPVEQYLVTRISSILADAGQRAKLDRAEAVKQAYLSATPDEQAAIDAAVPVKAPPIVPEPPVVVPPPEG